MGICGAMLTSFQQIQSVSALMSKPHRLSNISDRYAQEWSLRQFVTARREPARYGCGVWTSRRLRNPIGHCDMLSCRRLVCHSWHTIWDCTSD